MATTTTRGFRKPQTTDKIKDGATATANLADDVDAKIGRVERGTVTLDPAGTSAGQATINFGTAYTAVPHVMAIAQNGTASPVYAVKITAKSTTQFTVRMENVAGTTHTGTRVIDWIAIG